MSDYVSKFSSGTYTKVQYVDQKPWGSSSGLKVYSPTLLPGQGPSDAPPKPHSLSKSIFCNAKDCAPSIPSKISRQTWMTALPSLEGNFKQPHYDFGSEMIVESYDDDMQSVRITLQVDNSTLHT